MDMEEVQHSILEDLAQLGDPLSQMEYLLACAKASPGIPADQRREEALVPSCQAKTWVMTSWKGDVLHMQADSESFLVKGALALICEVYEGRSREEIRNFSCCLLDVPDFSDRLTVEQRKGLRGVLERLSDEAADQGREGLQ